MNKCSHCKHAKLVINASKNWIECLNPKTQQAIRFEGDFAGLANQDSQIRNLLGHLQGLRIQLLFAEDQFGCLNFEESDSE